MIISIKQPEYWCAVHSPVIFEFGFAGENLITVVESEIPAGKATFVFGAAMNGTAGDLLYISSGIYKGLHTITAIVGNIVATDTDYIGNDSGLTGQSIERTTFRLYAGFNPGEFFNAEDAMPYELIAEFTPEPNTQGVLRFDVSGYLQSIFNPSRYAELFTYSGNNKQYLTGLFNKFRLINLVSGEENTLFTGMALQSGATQQQLNSTYYNTGANLTEEIPSLVFASCKTDTSALNTFGNYLKRYTNGVENGTPVFFNDDFNSNFQQS